MAAMTLTLNQLLLIRYWPDVLGILFAFLSVLHVYWAFGGKWGGQVTIPLTEEGKPLFQAGPAACLIVALALGAAGVLVAFPSDLIRAGVPAGVIQAGHWLLFAVFLLRSIGDFRYGGLFRRVRHTPFARYDRMLFTPLCLVVACMLLVLNLN